MQFFKKVVPYTTKEGEEKRAIRFYIRRNEHSYPIEIKLKWDTGANAKRDWRELVEIAEELEK